ncbi:L10-interacting MYB domain-containing protein-like [Phalaenopsis equestris]|uniref:L10-interacting MYB domain-containing protein-like n=1 Tax=Phalaenopsis equestris TaxID=78828 RepID=UPI0009E54EA3|nr:L10-interacting MYB domain-containing protein-like [Phalaenopsis equestris]
MMKLKNKWDQLKNDWKLWKELKRGSTGLGWDPVKRTIDAPEESWVVPGPKKIKFNGIEPALEEKLDVMFTGVVATRTHFFTPNDQNNEFQTFREVRESDVSLRTTVLAIHVTPDT